MQHHGHRNPKPQRRFQRVGTRIYFNKSTERKIFFILTIGMLIYGIIALAGWF